MEHNLDKVDKLAAQLRSLQPISSENQKKLDRKFRLETNYNSNHLEGNTLTYSETELLLFFDDTKGNHTLREYEEMKAHDTAYHMVEEWAMDNERPLTEQNIKNLNEVILVRPFWKEAITPDGQNTRRKINVGDYKEHPNSVRLQNGELFEYASPTDTPIQMQELINWYRSEEKVLPPVTLAAMLHYKFVRIHPFDDGNGRVSRLLMNYVFLRNNLPPVIIKTKDKANYLKALHAADVGDYAEFISYIAEQLIWSLEISILAAKGEDFEEQDDLDKKLALLKQEVEAEDNENEIKTRLSVDTIKSAMEDWGINLFYELAKTTAKFNQFYDKPEHGFYIQIDNAGQHIEFSKEISFDKMYTFLNLKANEVSIRQTEVRLNTVFGAYKKGGTDSFGCNYTFMIKFEQYSYEVFIGYFTEEGQGQQTRSYTKRLLHKPLTTEEIKEINKIWGNTLLAHLEYGRKKLNKNGNG